MLERVQRRFTRMVPGLRGLDYGKRLERLGLLTLEERRNRSDLVELFKISRGLSAIPWDLFFWAGSYKRTGGRIFSHRVVNNWNGLSEEVVSAGSVNALKRKLDEFWKWKKDFLMVFVR